MIREPHAYVLGIPVTACDERASPLVLWAGSHRIMQEAMQEVLSPYPSEEWSDVDVTEAYQTARRRVFESCKRIKLVAQPGESYVLHRHLLHGIAPWEAGAKALPEGRIIIYFRPEFPVGVGHWLNHS